MELVPDTKKCYNKRKKVGENLSPKVKVRKKPVVVNAEKAKEAMFIDTLEGRMKAEKGDWIITGVNGEKYPVKPEIFEQTYEVLPD
ncbi:hypothetical protein [Staphylococcus epidermidis]|uniref:hypothetical protein n=1 Tax=Staphylococcus epidermidis TaxID=1282 RepID=UPI00374EC81E